MPEGCQTEYWTAEESNVNLSSQRCSCSIVIVTVISRFLKRYSKAKRSRTPAHSQALRRIKGVFPKGVNRRSGLISRIPGGDGVAVKVGVVQMGKVHDQMASEFLSNSSFLVNEGALEQGRPSPP